MKLLTLWIGILALQGCASHPEQEVVDEVNRSAVLPLGLAWMSSSNEVVVRVGGIEHVLLPGARNTPSMHAAHATATKEASNDAVQSVRSSTSGQRLDEQEVRDSIPSASRGIPASSRRRAHEESGDACPIVE